MRRKRLLLAAFAVIALSGLVPGPADAGGSSPLRFPGTSILVNVFEPAPRPAARREAAGTTKASVPATTPSVPKVVGDVALPESNPADLVSMRVVLRETQPGAPEPRVTASPCPRATTCQAYGLSPARWPTDTTGRATISFQTNETKLRSAREPAGALVPALQRASAQWSHWNSNIVFRNLGTTTAAIGARGKSNPCADGHNVIGWMPLEQGVVGAAFLCYDRTNRVIKDADLALNSILHWEVMSGTPRSRHSYDIQSILTHELGHWLSLIDLYGTNGGRQTMFGSADYGQTNKRSPGLGDVIGVQTAYPCGAGDSCPRSGIRDD